MARIAVVFIVLLYGVLSQSPSPYIVVEQYSNWTDANWYCQNTYGTTLATILTDDEVDTIRDEIGTLQPNFWVGLNDLETEGTWTWADGTTCPVSCTENYWNGGQPNNYQGGEDCGGIVAYFNGQYWSTGNYKLFNDFNCAFDNYYFICNAPPTEAPTNIPTQTPTNIPTQIPTNIPTQSPTIFPTKIPTITPTNNPTNPTINPTLSPTNPRTYIVVEQYSNWTDANWYCQNTYGTTLATILTDDEVDTVRDDIGTLQPNLWVGLNDMETEGTWTWADGTTCSVSCTENYWNDGQPNDYQGAEDCGAIVAYFNGQYWNTGNYKLFNDFECLQNYYFICNAPPTESPTNYPTNFPSNPTVNPTHIPTNIPTNVPTNNPTNIPSKIPTNNSLPPSDAPTDVPSKQPINNPLGPTSAPSKIPTSNPLGPTSAPNPAPSRSPLYPGQSHEPTETPTYAPALNPIVNSMDTPSPLVNDSSMINLMILFIVTLAIKIFVL